ncbi:hypothetical protein BGZ81_001284 [Podila clonocystis]|nr:hypothetical protein BGZ81_001284 [Podila clonocystis]
MRIHAFYFFLTVRKAWDDLCDWIAILQLGLTLDKDPIATVLGWPETKNLAPVTVRLHSVVVHSTYQTYCKIGDQDPIQKDELHWMIVLSFQRQAKTELTRARLKDNANKHIPLNSGNRCAPGPDEH